MDDPISAFLVAWPYLAGSMAGWASSNGKISLLILLVSALLIVPGIQAAQPLFEVSETLTLRLWGTAVCWTLFGLVFGFMANRYIRLVTTAGYIWTLGSAMVSTSLTSIVFDGLLPSMKDFQITPTLLEEIYSYLIVLPVGLLLVVSILPRNPVLGLKAAARKWLEFTTFAGLLELLSSQVFQINLLKASWWFPERSLPNGYAWFFNFALMGIVMLPGYLWMLQQKLPEGLGGLGLAAAFGEHVNDELNLRLDVLRVAYTLPEGWRLDQEQRTETIYNLLLNPESTDRHAVLQLSVFVFNEETIGDPERLKRLTQMNIVAQHGRIRSEAIRRCQDVLAYEIHYQTWRYNYMFHFVKHFREVYLIWSARDPLVFQCGVAHAQAFAESLVISPSVTEEGNQYV